MLGYPFVFYLNFWRLFVNVKAKRRIYDGFFAYFTILIVVYLINIFLTGKIFIYARLLAAAFILASSIFVTHRTWGFKRALAFKTVTVKQSVGVGAALAGAILLSIPFVLFFHLIAPDFAAVGFHILDNLPKGFGTYLVFLLILLEGVAKCFLFDGFLYKAFEVFPKTWQKYAVLSLTFAALTCDLYLFMPAFVFMLGITYVREKSENAAYSMILHVVFTSFSYALSQFTSSTKELLGQGSEFSKVLGMAMIFLACSLLILWVASSLLDKKSRLTPLGKLLVLFGFIVFLAIGSGLASI